MFINKVSFSAIKQTASEKAHQVGCFCGRKIEVLKANTSSLLSAIQSYASKVFKKLSEKIVLAKKTLVATKDYIVAKVSELAARVFKKKTTPADETKEDPALKAGVIENQALANEIQARLEDAYEARKTSNQALVNEIQARIEEACEARKTLKQAFITQIHASLAHRAIDEVKDFLNEVTPATEGQIQAFFVDLKNALDTPAVQAALDTPAVQAALADPHIQGFLPALADFRLSILGSSDALTRFLTSESNHAAYRKCVLSVVAALNTPAVQAALFTPGVAAAFDTPSIRDGIVYLTEVHNNRPAVQAEIARQATPVVAEEAPAPVVAAEAPAQANSTRRSTRNRKPTNFFTAASSSVHQRARRK